MNVRSIGNQVASLATYSAEAQTQQSNAQQVIAKAANDDAASVNVRAVNDAPNVDKAARLQEIKEQVRSGTYNPDSKDVATSLIRDLL